MDMEAALRYLALATDYDGTLAGDGVVPDRVTQALGRVAESGRRLILVTGRELDDLHRVFPYTDRFDRVVAENGALVYDPSCNREQALTEPPPPALVEELKRRHVEPLHVGRAIVATWHPHEQAVLDTIAKLGLEYQVIFNKGAVMVLPSGVNKASGLAAALADLALSPHNVVGVGDAENDHAFLSACECAVAVGNALPALKERADFVTTGDHGEGVVELVERLLENDLNDLSPTLARHDILLGTDDDDRERRLSPYGPVVLLAGTSGGGKSTIAMGFLERLSQSGYQFCLIDPEGDYADFSPAVSLGDTGRRPTEQEIVDVLGDPAQNVSVNLLGVPQPDRPAFFSSLFPHLVEMRASTGRPHWIVVDEAHHLLPAERDPDAVILPKELFSMLLVTVHPEHISRSVLDRVSTAIVVGEDPDATLASLGHATERSAPKTGISRLHSPEVVLWNTGSDTAEKLRFEPSTIESQRHRRKYAAGELAPEKSFYFRGPDGRLNLRAQNLMLFLQIAEGVDDQTWLHHLRSHDYSTWFREMIGDRELAEEAARVEDAEGDAGTSREAIRNAVEARYTAPE